jgi:tetratricopeptide (TPR) repeat protein
MADAPVPEDDANPALAETAADQGRDAARTLQRGERLGRYTILEVMGIGGMGVVYAAHDGDLDRKVAIKLLRASSDAELARARLLREARAMARLRHPNVITVYEAGAIDERVFVAMELVEGVTAGEWLDAPEPGRHWREVLEVFLAAGRGLAAAHAAGLVHRDFKPGNVLLDRGGRVVVTDFGLARQTDAAAGAAGEPAAGAAGAAGEPAAGAAGEEDSARAGADFDSASGSGGSDHTLTRTGAVLGTPAYMAPEQHRGSQADARSDQFSFCVALYEGLYGQRPFRGHSPATLHAAIVQGRIAEPPRGARGKQVPQRLRRILLRGLRAEPDERFPSMPALLGALERVARPWPRALLAAGAAVLVSVGVLLAALGMRTGAPAALDCTVSLDGAWDQGVAAAVRAVLARSPEGSEAFAALTARLDAGRAAWLDARAQICESERNDPDPWTFHRRMGCLLDYREQLAALTELLRAADTQAMGFAVSAAGELPDPAHCAQLAGAPPRLELADDPGRLAETARVRAELAQAAAAHQIAKFDRAIELGTSALAGARALGDRHLEAAALFRLADSHFWKHEVPLAQRHLREVVVLAEELDELAILAESLTLQALLVVGQPTRDGNAVRDLVRRARIAAGRVRQPGPMLGRLRLIEAHDHQARGAWDEAEVAYAEAYQLFVDARLPVRAARVELYWGLFLHMLGRLEEGKEKLERALAVMRKQVSAMSYEVVCLLEFAAHAAELLERYDEAVRLYDISMRRCPRLSPWERPAPPGPAGSAVAGHVVDDAGRPVAGAEIIVRAGVVGNGRHALRSQGRRDAFITRTAADGSFTVPGQNVREPVLVVATADSGRSLPVALQPGTGAGLTLRLRPYGGVRGRIERPAPEAAGAPAQPGVPPSGQASGQAPFQWVVFLPVIDPLPYRSTIFVPVRRDGSFAVERLPAGRYRVSLAQLEFLRLLTYACRWLPLGEIEVTAGDTRYVSFPLPAEPAAGRALEVQVRNRFDGVIPHAHILVFPGRTVPATIAEVDARWQSGDSGFWFAEVAPDPGQSAAGDAGRAALVHRFIGLPRGDLIACAVPLSENVPYGPEHGYPPYLDVYCVAVSGAERGPDQPLVVVIEAAPMRRRS